MLIASLLVNCAALDNYERRYGISYQDGVGESVEANVTLVPLKPKVIDEK